MKTTATTREEAVSQETVAEVKREESRAEAERRRQHRRRMLVKELKPFLFIGPHLIFFCVFLIVPFFFGIYISFTRWDMMGDPEFIWFENYENIFDFGSLFNQEFFSGLLHTCLYTVVMVPLLIIVPLVLAVVLNSLAGRRARSVFQAILYAPSLLSVATVVLIWRWMLDRELGAINNIFMSDINWAGSQPYAWLSIFMLTLWSGIGGNMVIFMAGLSNIPQTYYEAAEIDGANAWIKFIKITLPSMRFQLLYTTVMGTIGGFNVFGQPYMFGGPEESTTVLMMYIQQHAFGSSTPMAGMASAMSVLLGLIIAAFSAVQFKMMEAKD
mgnify:FL=1